MIDISALKKIYVYSQRVDMRMGMHKIKNIISLTYGPKEIMHSAFVFVSKDRRNIKIYYEDLRGSWLYVNKVQYFKYQVEGFEDVETITREDLNCLLQGVEMQTKRESKILV